MGCFLVSSLVGMVAMTALLSPKVWIALAFAAVLAALGVQTMRLDHAHAERAQLMQAYAEAAQKAEQEARATERKWQDRADQLGATKDEQIRDIGGKLDAALASLRNRPSRPAGDVPGTSSACKGGTGAGLYRDDSEFLSRLAARAAQIAAERDYCYARYESLQPGKQVP